MITYEQFCENCKQLEERVANACEKCGRACDSVRILPVTKTHPVDAVEYASRYGFASVGENRVQEIVEKFDSERGRNLKIDLELIGHLQTNKVKNAVERVARIQSVDSQKLLNKIASEAEKIGKTIRILLQINAGNDPAKFGEDVANAPALLEYALSKKYIKVEGLMTIAPLDENLDVASRCFENLRNLRDNLQTQFKYPLPELSMGMSDRNG
ncbi:MAG: YggS family pyridoxal phosphate-dependent enzyme [Opitutales bacterium]|nr:YggS family pyridoxal phosphate-dependent enzyme [Opitutales bacterium]